VFARRAARGGTSREIPENERRRNTSAVRFPGSHSTSSGPPKAGRSQTRVAAPSRDRSRQPRRTSACPLC